MPGPMSLPFVSSLALVKRKRIHGIVKSPLRMKNSCFVLSWGFTVGASERHRWVTEGVKVIPGCGNKDSGDIWVSSQRS